MTLRQLLKACTGLDLNDSAVERAARERVQAGAAVARADYAPQPGTPEFEALVDLVVVPESWMFRDPAVFTAGLRFVQRRLLSRPGAQVRILSLPCAGGEEPYSMAMALERAGIPPGRCRIDAVDLSQAAIARAHAGRYTRNAFRGADLGFRERYFTPERTQDNDAWLIRPELRAYVDFRQGNLFALDAAAGAYDLVFCRNLLIYFDDDGQRRAARAIGTLLAFDGLLLSGYAEAPAFCRNGFAPAPGHGMFALHKLASPQAPDRDALTYAPAPARMSGAAAARIAAPRRDPMPARAAAPDMLARAQRLADGGALHDAEAICRAVLAARPDHAPAYFLLGLVHDCGGNARAAEQCWRRCLYLQPEHYEALCSLALLHERRGESALAASLRRRAGRIYRRRAPSQA